MCHLHHLGFANPDSLWAGATDLDTEGVWFWDNGDPVDMVQSPWGDNQPNDEFPDHDCVILYRNTNYVMNDNKCTKKKPFICQIDLA